MLVLLATVAAAVAVPASASASSTTTLQLLNIGTSAVLYNWNFQPLGPNDAPAAGDQLVAEGVLHAGTHAGFGEAVVGTSREFCTFRSADLASCTGTLDITGGPNDQHGTLISKDTLLNPFAPTTVFPITGATGAFAGTASGAATVVAFNDTGASDVTVVLHQ